MKILISGYTGFIGSNLTKKLSENILYGVDIFQKNSVVKHFGWEALGDCVDLDCIVHLAGKAHDTKNTSSEQEYFDINVGLTQKIFQHFLKSTASKFILFSSVKAVADSVTGEQLTEEVIPNPKTPYGKSKLEAERYILSEVEKWREGEKAKGRMGDKETGRWGDESNEPVHIDKKVYILRPCMIHGPGNKGNLNLLFDIQQKGLPWPLGAFENKRSFCSVDNILFVVQQLIEKNIEPGIYQVADDEALSINELIKLMASSQSKKARIWRISAKSIKAIARVGDLLHLPLNSERLKKLTESYLVSNQKIKNALSIDKMPVTAMAGLQKTFESFKRK
ncbi:MAG TPA: NAD-dependent epimerase/dehydratase family protein [Paludibacter sp.]